METNHPSAFTRFLAKVCLNCPVCTQARKTQTGLCYWLTNRVEHKLCPFCRAYARVYGKKPHELRHDQTVTKLN